MEGIESETEAHLRFTQFAEEGRFSPWTHGLHGNRFSLHHVCALGRQVLSILTGENRDLRAGVGGLLLSVLTFIALLHTSHAQPTAFVEELLKVDLDLSTSPTACHTSRCGFHVRTVDAAPGDCFSHIVGEHNVQLLSSGHYSAFMVRVGNFLATSLNQVIRSLLTMVARCRITKQGILFYSWIVSSPSPVSYLP